MAKRRVDYDRIAPAYNKRFASGRRSGTAAALTHLAHTLHAGRVLEVGCGTGHWLALLHPVVAGLYGLDASQGMLLQAHGRTAGLELVRGFARRLPFPRGFFDLVLCVNAIHHFDDPQAFISEAARTLRPGGILALVGTDPHERRDSWYAYHFFPGVYENDLARFPPWPAVSEWMAASGFGELALREIERISEPKHGRAVLDDPFLKKNACSQLALLTDQAYAQGLRAIQSSLTQAEAQGDSLIFQTEIAIAMLSGRKS